MGEKTQLLVRYRFQPFTLEKIQHKGCPKGLFLTSFFLFLKDVRNVYGGHKHKILGVKNGPGVELRVIFG